MTLMSEIYYRYLDMKTKDGALTEAPMEREQVFVADPKAEEYYVPINWFGCRQWCWLMLRRRMLYHTKEAAEKRGRHMTKGL